MSWFSDRVPNFISKTWHFNWTGHKEKPKEPIERVEGNENFEQNRKALKESLK